MQRYELLVRVIIFFGFMDGRTTCPIAIVEIWMCSDKVDIDESSKQQYVCKMVSLKFAV